MKFVDRNGIELAIGDRIRFQYCAGRYGQVATGEMILPENFKDSSRVGRARFEVDFAHQRKTGEQRLIGYHRHVDYEHGHETWVEKIGHETSKL